MNVLVIGTGAVGCAMAIATAHAGMDTAVVARGANAKAIKENGLKRTGIFGEMTVSPDRIRVFESIDRIDSEYDFVIVATKTMANKEIADELADNQSVLGRNGKIVIFQNGWGNDEPFLVHFSAAQVYNARVITGFERTLPWVTNVTVHTAPILLGSLYKESIDELKPLAKAIRDSGIPSETSEEIAEALWAKMLYNTTLNPLGAIMNMSYGELAASPHLVCIMNRLIEETFAVMDAAGCKTFWKSHEEYKNIFYSKLVPDTFSHRASTLQDIERHRKTEIDTLNGCIQRLGKKHNVQTPTHDFIIEMIRGIEDIRCGSVPTQD